MPKFLGPTLTQNGNAIWHVGNDGSGSNLDADLLDGINSLTFARKDQANTFTSLQTLNGGLTVTGTISFPSASVGVAALSGTLPIANGGTGSSTQNFVDLTNSQSIGGTKTFTSSLVASAGANVSNGGLIVGGGGTVTINNTATPTINLVPNTGNSVAITAGSSTATINAPLVVNGSVSVNASDANEGGEITFKPGSSYTGDTTIDRYQNRMRVHHAGSERYSLDLTNGQITLYHPGTTSTPAITWSGDTNTGIYKDSGATVSISTGGQRAALFDINANFIYGPLTGNNKVQGQYFQPSGLTGATTQTRYVGGVTTAAPSTGTFSTGDWVVGTNGSLYVCTAGGAPGTWVQAGGGGGAVSSVSGTGNISVSPTTGATVVSIVNNPTFTGTVTGNYFNTGAGSGSYLGWPGSPTSMAYSYNSGSIAFAVQGQASQTADLQQWRNSSNTVLARVTAGGKIVAETDADVAIRDIMYWMTVGV